MTPSRLASAERLARAAIARHLPGWGFGWVEDSERATARTARNARREGRGIPVARTLGRCDFERREIQLSRAHALRAPAEDVWTTILHEIAHGLASSAGDFGHGEIWHHFCAGLGIEAHAAEHRAKLAAR